MKCHFYAPLTVLLLMTLGTLGAQTPTDAIMMPKGEVCLALTYDHGSWDEYWEGSLLRSNGNVGTLTRTTVTPGVALGIIDRVNVFFSLPYVKTSSDGGQLSGADGFQDFGVAVKANILEKQVGKGKFYVLPVAEFSTPASNYLADYAPYSIGHGATQFALRGIVQYKFDMGLYVRGSAAHQWRTYSRIERDYYYNNGSYYSEYMDVPNAWHYEATAGLWLFDNKFKIEGNYTVLRCTSGDDIRVWNAGQPTNNVEVNQVGGSIHYYFKFLPGLRVIGQYATMLEGRNMGKFTNFGGTLTYQFKIF